MSDSPGKFKCYTFYWLTDVPGVNDVIIEASEKDADNMELSLTDDIILQMFPYSAAVPAALETRNKQRAAFMEEKSNLKNFCSYFAVDTILCHMLILHLRLRYVLS